MSSKGSEYVPKSILVTGCGGFLGANLCVTLCRSYPNATVAGLEHFQEDHSSADVNSITDCKKFPNFRLIEGSMNSADLIQHVFSIHKFDTVILVHNDNYDNRHHNDKFGNSFSLTHVSLMGTHIVMEAAKHSGHIQKFIYISSDELYGRVTSKANVSEDCKSVGEDISEESKDQEQPMPDPRNPYAACMLGAEHLIKSYFKSFRFPAILVRVCNTFGPKQPMDRFIPKSINSLLHGQSCTVHGDGSNSRYWLYVSDFVNAIDLIIKNGAVGQTYNVGAEQATSNLEALKAIVRIVDKSKQEASVLKYEPDRQLDDRRYKLDTASMRALGWQPDISFETGIRLTAMWIECKVNAAE